MTALLEEYLDLFYYMLRYVNIDELLPMQFEMEFFSAKLQSPCWDWNFTEAAASVASMVATPLPTP